MNHKRNVGVILLAGGIGSRMQSSTPKQFLQLGEKPIAQYGLDIFLEMGEITQLVLVCAPEYRVLFPNKDSRLTFALPGKRRQDSVYSGLQELDSSCSLVCVHDAARPFITSELVRRVINAASEHGAATAGMPIKFTVKECCSQQMISQTLERSRIWEIQTPQVMQRDLLQRGFSFAHSHNITVTDDVSLVELLQHSVKVVEGSYNNIKITTPEDLAISQHLFKQQRDGTA
jgi:2-C-methyl-D-erythritol 4-phosphate cytidylyltransferase